MVFWVGFPSYLSLTLYMQYNLLALVNVICIYMDALFINSLLGSSGKVLGRYRIVLDVLKPRFLLLQRCSLSTGSLFFPVAITKLPHPFQCKACHSFTFDMDKMPPRSLQGCFSICSFFFLFFLMQCAVHDTSRKSIILQTAH